MKTSLAICLFVVSTATILCGYTLRHEDETDIKGVWIRTGDKLRIEVAEENSDHLYSFIVADGEKKFPCDVSSLPIYKNIVKVGKNLWRCDFLVVTMGSCSTDYEEGIIQITQRGTMEITCPGFAKKIYTKVKPRYEGKAQL
jgi:hypothetical protein